MTSMTKMRNKRNDSGSALLMVVGLLTILGMLGGVFLVITSMHNRVSGSLAANAPLEEVPHGVLEIVVTKLTEDLYIEAVSGESGYGRGPYGAANAERQTEATAQEIIRMYVDSFVTDGFLGEDAGIHIFPDVTEGDRSVDEVDVDGDGELDAYLYPTGVWNCNGEKIYAAVKIEDLSSLICVNTAYRKNALSSSVTTTPVEIGLRDLLIASLGDTDGEAVFDNLHNARCGGERTPVPSATTFNSECALRLSTPEPQINPDNNYQPFSMADELYIRWKKPAAATNTGKLYGVLENFGGKHLLTTWGRSRSLFRHPQRYSYREEESEHYFTTFEDRLYINSTRDLGDPQAAISGKDEAGADVSDATIAKWENRRRFLHRELEKVYVGGSRDIITVDNSNAADVLKKPPDADEWLAVELPSAYNGNYHHSDGSGHGASKTFAFKPSLPMSGAYEVSMQWPADAGNAATVYVEVNYSGGQYVTTINQKVAPNDPIDGTDWQPLGTTSGKKNSYYFEAGIAENAVVIRTAGAASGKVVADAVQFKFIVPEPIILDDSNTDPEIGTVGSTGTWTEITEGSANDGKFHRATGEGHTFTFTPNIITPGRYKVSIHWPDASSSFANNISVEIHHGGAIDGPIIIDQQSTSATWESLDGYYFDAGTGGKIVINTDAINPTTGHVAADAVKLVWDEQDSESDVDHFVANLWAHMYNPWEDHHKGEYTFNISGAFGVVPQLAISEAYACSAYQDMTTSPDPPWTTYDSYYAYAIELYNPTDEDIDVSNYILKCGTRSWNFSSGNISNGGKVEPGGRIVLYNVGGNSSPSGPTPGQSATGSDFGFSSTGDWCDTGNKLDFMAANADGKPVRIVRKTTNVLGEDVYVPVDSVSGSEIRYNVRAYDDGSSTTLEGPNIGHGERDDNTSRKRVLVAVMAVDSFATPPTNNDIGEHTLDDADDIHDNSGKNHVSTLPDGSDPLPEIFDGVYDNYTIEEGADIPANLGILVNRYIVGPDANGADLPHKLATICKQADRGRISYETTGGDPGEYPAVSFPTVLGELLELVPNKDSTSEPEVVLDSAWRYGRININTASKEVLEQLPFPSVDYGGTYNYTFDAAEAAEAIVAYRGTVEAPKCFQTPAEVTAALRERLELKLGPAPDGVGYEAGEPMSYNSDIVMVPKSFYNAVSNLITVNSDVFVAYIRTQLGDSSSTNARYHVAVIDRSNCKSPDDRPEVLLFAEIK